jgi:hypothetical protein
LKPSAKENEILRKNPPRPFQWGLIALSFFREAN